MKRIRQRIDPHWYQVTFRQRIHFYDLDPMEVVWHGHYVRFMEAAREEFFRSRGLSYRHLADLGISAPVARMQLEFFASARMDDELVIRVAGLPTDRCLLTLIFEMRNVDGTMLCVAESVQAFADMNGEVYRTVPEELAAFLALPGMAAESRS